MRLWGNDYNVREAGGAFGDLGTLIPFLVGYLTITKLDPVGVLVAFGLFKIVAGLYFRTPMPIQPMKAIGTVAISQAGAITPGAIWASGLFTGILWLTMGLTGAVSWIARITSRPVVQGLVLGLGLAFMLEGVKFMEGDYLTAIVAVGVTFVLLSRERVPAMLVLLLFGAVVAVARQPVLFDEFSQMAFRFQLPHFALAGLRWEDMLIGVFGLGLPQAALTLGNAIITTVEENNTLFPDRRITVRGVAIDHGLMNLVGTSMGGIPMCHGAGGMAGHVRFGARTGGSLVILGVLVLFVGLFLADSAATLFKLFPASVLGAILFFGGLELAAGSHGSDLAKNDRYVLLVTAGVSMWNMGAGYLAGLLLWRSRNACRSSDGCWARTSYSRPAMQTDRSIGYLTSRRNSSWRRPSRARSSPCWRRNRWRTPGLSFRPAAQPESPARQPAGVSGPVAASPPCRRRPTPGRGCSPSRAYFREIKVMKATFPSAPRRPRRPKAASALRAASLESP